MWLGAKDTTIAKATDLVAESGRGISLRSNRWIGALSSSSDGSVKTGTPGGGLPPRIPKRKLEMLSSLDSQKKSRIDGQNTPALGEVIDGPQRSEDCSDFQRSGPLQSPTILASVPSNDLLKLDAEIMNLEWRLHNLTLRRDHLGTDDIGRHYWALSGSNQKPVLVVSECDVNGRFGFGWDEESAFLYVERSCNGDGHIQNKSNGKIFAQSVHYLVKVEHLRSCLRYIESFELYGFLELLGDKLLLQLLLQFN